MRSSKRIAVSQTEVPIEMDSILARLAELRDAYSRFEDTLFTAIAPVDRRGLVISAAVQRSQGWRRAREQLLTASNFATVCELNPYCDAYALHAALTGVFGYVKEKSPPSPDKQRGLQFESRALDHYSLVMGVKTESTGLFLHESYTRLGASPDAFVVSPFIGLVEVKCPRLGPHQAVPDIYMPQIQGQLEICQKEVCDFVSWHCSLGMKVFRVSRSHEYWQWMLPQLFEFIECLDSGRAPKRRSQIQRMAPPRVKVDQVWPLLL